MRIKTVFLFSAAVILAACTGYVIEQPQESIEIGVIIPLTGPTGFIGQDMREGINLAVEEVNSLGGVNGVPVEVFYEDSQGKPTVAINSYRKLRESEAVNLFITTLSHVTLALAPLAEKKKTPVVTIAVAPSILEGDYVFMNNFNGEQELGYLVDFIASEFQYTRVGILAQKVEFGQQYADVLEREWLRSGGVVTEKEFFHSSESDYRTFLWKIEDSNPDFIYIVGYSPHLARILVQAKELGIKRSFFSYWGAQEKELLEVAEDSAEGLMFPSSTFRKNRSPSFFEKYESKYGKTPHYRAGLAYDIVGMLVEAVKKCESQISDTVCIKDKIYEIKDYPGVTGLTTVTPEGGTTKEIIMWKVQNKTFVPIY